MPMTQVFKKRECFIWNDECQESFPKVEEELLQLQTLLAPVPDIPFILFVSHTKFMVATILVQADDHGRERPIYYLSHMMSETEKNYSKLRKLVLC